MGPTSFVMVQPFMCAWLAVIFGIANEKIDILSSIARVFSGNSMSVHSMSYYKLERGKNEESEGEGQGHENNGCLPLQHTLGSAPSAERRRSLETPGENHHYWIAIERMTV